MNKSLAEQVQEAYKVLSEFLNIDIPKLISESSKSRSINLWKYGKEKIMYEIYCLIQQESYDPAYQKCVDLIKETLNEVRIKYIKPSEIIELGCSLIKCAHVLEDFDEYFSEERIKLQNYLFSNKWLKPDEKVDNLTKHFNWNWIHDAHEAIKKGFIKSYIISGNPQSIPEDVNYTVSDVIIISDQQVPLKSKVFDDDLIHVSVFMKIEQIIDYSFFIIRFQYHDTCIIATDKMKFVNPRVATCSRNPSRRREEYYQNVDLPYYIIDDILKWRQESKELTKATGTETYIKPLRDYLVPAAKICLRLIIEDLISELRFTQTTEKIGYASETIKLIGSGETESRFAKTNYEACENFAKERILPPSSNELVVLDKNELLVKHGSPTSLLTYAESQALTEWLEKESIREHQQNALNEYAEKHTISDRKLLQLAFHENFEDVAEILFSGEQVFGYVIDAPLVTSHFGSHNIDNIQMICGGPTNAKDGIPHGVVHAHTSDDKSIYDYFGCINHQDFRAREKMTLNITSWKQVVGILNMKREYLPFSYQNYNSHQWIPYYGNPILDNVNPEFLVTDYLSRYHANGISITFYLCKNCVNSYYKRFKKFKQSLVLMSYLNNCVVDIVDYDAFLNENAHLFTGKRYYAVMA